MATSYRKLVNEKCKQCTYDPLSGLGTWREQTMACTVASCPLWPVRPVSRKETDKERVRRMEKKATLQPSSAQQQG